ncbi:MAG: hypothetical protein SF123_05575 [Chloroflexota bacterium]|nr:hypothetical protein [Chloroflexota bacterium]
MRKQERTAPTLETEIEALVQCIREDHQIIEEAEGRIREAKRRLEQLLKMRGSNWADDLGYARLMSTGRRTFYDTEDLDRLLISDPLRYGWLKDYRRESIIPERVQVK